MKYLLLSMNPGFDRWHIVETEPKLPRVCRANKALGIVSGKGLNVARAFHRLGFENYSCLNIEGGRIGRLISAACRDEGLNVQGFEVGDESRINLTILKEYERDTMSYNEPGPCLLPAETGGFLHAVRERLASNPDAALVISGSAPDGFDLAAYLRMLDDARADGHPVMADIGGAWLPETVGGPLALLKINREEFELAFGFDGYADTAALTCFAMRKGIKTVVLTDGASGSISVSGHDVVRCTLLQGCGGCWAVGSGDAFFAGYLSALADECPPAECMKVANACGIANTFVYGPCTFDAAAVKDCYGSVGIEIN